MEKLKETFKNYDINTKSFSLAGKESYCRLVDVIDGDTISVIIPLFDDYYKFSLRLDGIDTFEIKSKNAELHKIAIKGRNRLFELLINKKIETDNYERKDIQEYCSKNVVLIFLKCCEFDKYGRLLAKCYHKENQECVSNILLKERLAYRYTGATKMSETEQLEYYHNKENGD